MWLRKLQGMDLEKNLAKHVSTVVKKVTLLKTKIVQLEVERVVVAVNMVIMLIIAKGEEAQSRENKAPLYNKEADSDAMFKEDESNLWRVILRTQVRMTHFAFTIEEQICALSTSAEPVISVSIDGVIRDILIDSDSASNLISTDTLQELKH